MSEAQSGRTHLILACVLVLLAAAVLVGLLVSASQDESPRAWAGRRLGFGMGVVALAVGIAMFKATGRSGRPYWGLVGALTLAALLTGAYSYKPKLPQAGAAAESIAMQVGGWAGETVVEDEKSRKKTEKILGTTDMIMRTYTRGADRVHLAVIHATSNRKVAHPPEQCYAADGFEMEDIARDSFTTHDGTRVDVKRLVIIRGRRRGRPDSEAAPREGVEIQVVYYWYRAGTLNTPDFVRQQIHVILSNLLMRTGTRVALIRLSSYIQDLREKEDAIRRLKNFSREIFPEIQRCLK